MLALIQQNRDGVLRYVRQCPAAKETHEGEGRVVFAVLK